MSGVAGAGGWVGWGVSDVKVVRGLWRAGRSMLVPRCESGIGSEKVVPLFPRDDAREGEGRVGSAWAALGSDVVGGEFAVSD